MAGKSGLFVLGLIGLTYFGYRTITTSSEDQELRKRFDDYIVNFNKTYKGNETEYEIRLENFKQSLKLIEELNKNRVHDQSALYGVTVFSDLSRDEFKELHLQRNGRKQNSTSSSRYSKPSAFRSPQTSDSEVVGRRHLKNMDRSSERRFKRASDSVPMFVDWRREGVIGPVHNQKTCGACWAFSTIETVEAMNAMKNRIFTELSVQEVIDCAGNQNFGCEGGDSCLLLEWLIDTGTKITSEKAYPFVYHTQTCKYKFPKVGVAVKNYACEQYVGDEDLLLELLAYHGPVAAAVNAINWQFYLGGIIRFHCTGATQDMNHAVQIIGYDRRGPVPHYIIRNSWGGEFGDNGYLYIAVGGNVCGIANEVSSLDVV